jgi:hypothetical protein
LTGLGSHITAIKISRMVTAGLSVETRITPATPSGVFGLRDEEYLALKIRTPGLPEL